MNAPDKEKTFYFFSEINERAFHRGIKKVLPDMMAISIVLNKPMPEWVRAAFIEAYDGNPQSWDDVFGKPLNNKKRQMDKEKTAVAKAAATMTHRKIDDNFFEDLAVSLGMKAGTTKRRYYSTRPRGKTNPLVDEQLSFLHAAAAIVNDEYEKILKTIKQFSKQ